MTIKKETPKRGVKFDIKEDGKIIGGFIDTLTYSKLFLHGISLFLAYFAGLTIIENSVFATVITSPQILAFGIALVFELLVYFVLPYPVAMFARSRWGSGNKFFMVVMGIIGIIILLASPIYSYLGTAKVSTQMGGSTDFTNTTGIDSTFQMTTDSITTLSRFKAKEINTSFDQLAAATKDKYRALIAEQVTTRTRYQKLYDNGTKWAIGHVQKTNKKISQIKTKRAAELAELEGKRLERITANDNRLTTAVNEVSTTKAGQLERINAADKKRIALNTGIKKAGQNVLVCAAIGSMFLLLLFLIIEERYFYQIGVDPAGRKKDSRKGRLGTLIAVCSAQKNRLLDGVIVAAARGLTTPPNTTEPTPNKIGFQQRTTPTAEQLANTPTDNTLNLRSTNSYEDTTPPHNNTLPTVTNSYHQQHIKAEQQPVYTVLHKNRNTGIVEPVTLKTINKNIGNYKGRVNKSFARWELTQAAEDKATLQDRQKVLNYWNDKRNELLIKKDSNTDKTPIELI